MPYTEAVELLKKTAKQSFWNKFWSIPDPFDGLVSYEDSTQSQETRALLGSAPMPQEWVGDVEPKPTNEYTRTTTNKPYESTVPIGKKTIKFQQWDEVATHIANQAEKARAHKAKLLTTKLEAGISSTCLDGQYFFDDDHAHAGAEYTTSQDNDLTAAIVSATAPTAAEAATGLRACFNSLYGFKDDRGDPMVPKDAVGNPADFIVMVPPSFMTRFRQVLVADTLSAAGDNDLKGTFTLRVNPFMSGTKTFYMFYASSNWKPFIVQEAGGMETQDWYDNYSGNYFHRVNWWGAVDYGAWQTAVSYIFTTA